MLICWQSLLWRGMWLGDGDPEITSAVYRKGVLLRAMWAWCLAGQWKKYEGVKHSMSLRLGKKNQVAQYEELAKMGGNCVGGSLCYVHDCNVFVMGWTQFCYCTIVLQSLYKSYMLVNFIFWCFLKNFFKVKKT